MTPNGSDDWDEGNGLDALDFHSSEFDDGASGLDALPDYAADNVDLGNDHGAGLDAVNGCAGHEGEDVEEDGLAAIDGQGESEDQEQVPVVQAINPPGTVTVTAYLSGSVAQVNLDPKVTMLTEAELADEIRFVAEVAAKRATAVMHIGVVDMLVEQGMDFHEARDLVGKNMPYATPEQAAEAELALVARHSDR
ncbi:hypothetical protein [Mycolicibacterium septicum]|uniref:hypothetical protein n=1 Tax=Mycolicibacterium septicum TaxID=98668 RepID=UPI001AF5AE7A|nr:hypothetical protein [Mycolicibacterium septicum]QRY52817.1 hypothetical protein JVX95_05500 [Mycolicibacterium septicum]